MEIEEAPQFRALAKSAQGVEGGFEGLLLRKVQHYLTQSLHPFRLVRIKDLRLENPQQALLPTNKVDLEGLWGEVERDAHPYDVGAFRHSIQQRFFMLMERVVRERVLRAIREVWIETLEDRIGQQTSQPVRIGSIQIRNIAPTKHKLWFEISLGVEPIRSVEGRLLLLYRRACGAD